MKVRLGPRVMDEPGLAAAIVEHCPSRGNAVALVRLVGLRRHLTRTLVAVIVKERDEGVGAASVAPS